MRFPKIIHQIWFQGEDNLPVQYKKYSDTWKNKHKDYEHMIWDSESIETLIDTHYSKYKDAYLALPKMIQKIDYAKYFIIHRFGGIYTDMDTECLKSIDPLLRSSTTDLLIPDMGLDFFEKLTTGCMSKKLYNNSFIVSTRLNPVWKGVHLSIKHMSIKQKWNESNFNYIFRTTGPKMLSDVLNRYNSSYAPVIGIIENNLIDPIKWCDYEGPDNIDRDKIQNAFSIQHWGSKSSDTSISWSSNKEMFAGICLCQLKKLWWLVLLVLILLLLQRTGVTRVSI